MHSDWSVCGRCTCLHLQDILERMCMKQIALMGGSISGEIRRCQLEVRAGSGARLSCSLGWQ